MVAAAASVTAVALLASAAPWDTGAPASPGGSPPPTSASATTGPTAPPYVGDGVLVVRPMPEATPGLTRGEAQLIMVNGSPSLRLPGTNGPNTYAVEFTLGSVELDESVVPSDARFPVPRAIPLAWVASYDTGPAGCGAHDVKAYVLAADGSTAFVYHPVVPACRGAASRPALTERAVNLISVPWTAMPASGGRGHVVAFSVPDCAKDLTLELPHGLVAVAAVPIGARCSGSRDVTVPWTGDVEEHGRLGPFRQTDHNGLAPLLEQLPSPSPEQSP